MEKIHAEISGFGAAAALPEEKPETWKGSPPMEDDAIVELFIARDQSALTETAEKYGPRLRALANGVLHDPSAAEECENDAYLQAWNSIPPHEPRGYLFPFLAKITRHLALDVCRHRGRKKRGAPLSQLTREMEQCIPDPSDAQGQVDGVLLAQAVGDFLRSQPEERRNMFIRRYWYLDPVAVVAKRFGVTQSKVKTTLFRVREELKEYLIKEGYQL